MNDCVHLLVSSGCLIIWINRIDFFIPYIQKHNVMENLVWDNKDDKIESLKDI